MSGTGNTSTSGIVDTGDIGIDSLLSGRAWTGGILTYSFPTAAADYGLDYPDDATLPDFQALSADQQAVFEFALDADVGPAAQAGFAVESFVNLDVSLGVGNTHIRGADSSMANPTAYAYYPSGGFNAAGDVWFGTDCLTSAPMAQI